LTVPPTGVRVTLPAARAVKLVPVVLTIALLEDKSPVGVDWQDPERYAPV
jgi:hypothetical protein